MFGDLLGLGEHVYDDTSGGSSDNENMCHIISISNKI